MNNRTKLSVALAASLTVIVLAGCLNAPPTKIETKLFEVVTNTVSRVITVTNIVPEVQIQVQTVQVTNTVTKEVAAVQMTNTVTVYQTNTQQVMTNASTYTYTPNANAAAAGSIASGIGSAIGGPGVGSLVGWVIALGFSTWAGLRSRSSGQAATAATNTANALAQVIEVGRAVLTSKYGAQAADVWKNWMIQHQVETGVINNVLGIVKDKTIVDSAEASDVADGLIKLMDQVQNSQSPTQTTVKPTA